MNVKLKPIPRRSSVDQVVERIREVIEQQKLSAGQRLPGELELVEQLRVSRPVLREALARLQGLGLVEIQRGNGTFVANRDVLANCVQLLRSAVTLAPRELLVYTELRSAIEVQAVRLAAERATDADISDLQDLLKELDSIDRPYAELLELDFRFHRRILQAAGNPLMQNLMEVIYEFVVTQMAQTTPSPRDNQLGRSLHRRIFAAIKSHDQDAADQAMREHMEAVLVMLKKRVNKRTRS
ncbi:Putative L-lactate dehydrogenase operon regulatory protein [Planctomycetes bacterium Pan216]|uniref:L-lactate dehydrogenase operon regulatory protein n=2 Tax=Kolteria novifilia TaxID=2527975 RepID=A0A518AZX8_9BACT|nr:Putative L-lactate dehydrogenase operon regulatory protein [Planctomycetes bacterium Pan216]